MKDFIISEFTNMVKVRDPNGHRLTVKSRYASCFIITYKGAVQFTFENKTLIADPTHAIFIPKGATYANECLKDAESLVVNFETVNPHEPCQLNPIDEKTVLNIMNNVNKLLPEADAATNCRILSELYLLAYKLFHVETKRSAKQSIVDSAMAYFQANLQNPELKISDVARKCNVSSVYLRRVFCDVLDKTPFEALTDVRMSAAHTLVLENRSVTEIALAVGYSDIYQFSRAYKRYFGFSPTRSVN